MCMTQHVLFVGKKPEKDDSATEGELMRYVHI